MTALIAETTTLRTVGRKIAMQVVGVVAALGLVTACTTSDSGGPSNQAMGTFMGAAVGGAVGGLAFGSAGGVIGGALVGALAGNLVGRALDQQERARLAQATQNAFVADTNVPTTYTVEPTTPTTPPPTVVAAKPVGPADHPGRRQHLPADRADGDQERPDDDRDDDLLQGLRFGRSEAGFGLIHNRRPARFQTVSAVALRKGAWQPLARARAHERRE